MVSRTVAKMFQANLKSNVYKQLSDVGFFYDKFSEVTLKTDVLPWLFEQTDNFLAEINAANQFPTDTINHVIEKVS